MRIEFSRSRYPVETRGFPGPFGLDAACRPMGSGLESDEPAPGEYHDPFTTRDLHGRRSACLRSLRRGGDRRAAGERRQEAQFSIQADAAVRLLAVESAGDG